MKRNWKLFRGALSALGLSAIVFLVPSLYALQPLKPGQVQPVTRVTKIIDPCAIATSQQLNFLLSAGIGAYFPLKSSKDGEHITISSPKLTNVACPHLRITMSANISYKKTQGIPQFSSSGDVKFASPLVAKVTHKFPLTQATDVEKATACLTDINIIGLNLKNVPNWLDNTWVRNWLNGKLANQMCFDITGLVIAYIQSGGSL